MKKVLLVVLIALVSIRCSDDSIGDSIDSDNLFWESNKNRIWERTYQNLQGDNVHQYFKFHDNLQKPFDYYSDNKEEKCYNQHGIYFESYSVKIEEQTKNSITLLIMQDNSFIVGTYKFSISGNQLVHHGTWLDLYPDIITYNRTSLTYGDIIQCP